MPNDRFTWIPFFAELSRKLLHYRDDRKSLLRLIYSHRDCLSGKFLHDSGGEEDRYKDIDPFTVIGMVNRQLSRRKRTEVAETMKKLFSIRAALPTDFCGVPVLNNQKSIFFGFKDKRGRNDINNLWALFEKVVLGKDCSQEFNRVSAQFLIRANITMALFWIKPSQFISLDRTNRNYLSQYDITLPQKVSSFEEYQNIIAAIETKMKRGEIKEQSFEEISFNAYRGGNNDATEDVSESSSRYGYLTKLLKRRKNIVLQGAPGTGKTYMVPELVVRLCSPSFDAENADRGELMNEYHRLKNEGRVAFTTFHQSMDYEDWVEGLRPSVEEGQVQYEVLPGVFKRLCERASRPIVLDDSQGIASDATIWKVSLAGTGDNPVRRDCMQQGYIRIGWDGYGAEITEQTDWSIHDHTGKQILDAFINQMKVGDIVFSCYSNRQIDAIGVVTGNYEWHDGLKDYKRVRRVNWLAKGLEVDIVKMNAGKTMTLGTVYRLNAISLEEVKQLLDEYGKPNTLSQNTQPYVVVIDELNRGNVSKIFGELITLLEPDKREGELSGESVVLPYSKEAFSVPSNVYIIATMNTADRSLDTIDYAIQRRFAFVRCLPYDLDIEGFDSELFAEISKLFVYNYDQYEESSYDDNIRLEAASTLCCEYRPEDVWIGHSYFLCNEKLGIEDRLRYEILPLLEHYLRDGVLTPEAEKTITILRDRANNESTES